MIKFSDIGLVNKQCQEGIENVFQELLKSSGFINGEYLNKFEQSFAKYLGVKHVIGVANGTDAIEIALRTIGVGTGDEVIIPNHTWISTASAVVSVGATPVFVDCSSTTYIIEAHFIEKAITNKTKAILPVHLYGLPCDMAKIKEIAIKYNLKVIEDTAQAHGAEFNGVKCGTIGDLGTFSFYPAKNLGAFGDGGCIATNSDEYAAFAKSFINCGQITKNTHNVMGRNSRLDGLQAGILNEKLPLLDTWNNQRIEAAKLYTELFKGHSEIQTPTLIENRKHVFHLYVIQTENREKIIENFKKNDIQFGIHYPSFLNKMGIFKPYMKDFTSMNYDNKILSLPMFPGIKKEEIEFVVENCLNL